MTDKAARDMLSHTQTLETLIALELAFTCLLDNLKNTNLPLAQALSQDLLETARQTRHQLPPEIKGVSDMLDKWSELLSNDPKKPFDRQSS